MYDIAIIGGGISGFSAALRLQSKGLKTIVLESHGQLGGCAGFFSKRGFSFDVGATTLVDFVEGGIGGSFFNELKYPLPEGEYLDYVAWLPDRNITLYRDKTQWNKERLEKLGSSENHIAFWKLMDRITDVFWNACRKNIKLPFQNFNDFKHAFNVIGIKNIFLLRYYNSTMLDVLKKFKLEHDKPLIGLLSILIEDTIHSTIDKAPFINSALGTTIRGAGLMRANGGMKGFWNYLSSIYLQKGGVIKKGTKVLRIQKDSDQWILETSKEIYYSKKIISSLPIQLTNTISPDTIKDKLASYISNNAKHEGSAIVLFLGVPESELSGQCLRHHQLLQDYNTALGNGNNMFISVSAKDDLLSAPAGYCSVMISTHCSIKEWMNLSEQEYETKKDEIGKSLLTYARKIYPSLGTKPIVYEVGTLLTYQKYTNRILGSVGGFKQTYQNSNFNAVPQDIGEKDFWIVGDTTWPGLGTVAGLIASRIVSEYAANKN